jgi:hypothetical protein
MDTEGTPSEVAEPVTACALCIIAIKDGRTRV